MLHVLLPLDNFPTLLIVVSKLISFRYNNFKSGLKIFRVLLSPSFFITNILIHHAVPSLHLALSPSMLTYTLSWFTICGLKWLKRCNVLLTPVSKTTLNKLADKNASLLKRWSCLIDSLYSCHKMLNTE